MSALKSSLGALTLNSYRLHSFQSQENIASVRPLQRLLAGCLFLWNHFWDYVNKLTFWSHSIRFCSQCHNFQNFVLLFHTQWSGQCGPLDFWPPTNIGKWRKDMLLALFFELKYLCLLFHYQLWNFPLVAWLFFNQYIFIIVFMLK